MTSSLHPTMKRDHRVCKEASLTIQVASAIQEKLFADSILVAVFGNALASCCYKWQFRQRASVSEWLGGLQKGINSFKEIVEILTYRNV